MRFLVLVTALVLAVPGMAQETVWQRYKKLSGPEKRWVATHPFVAKKAMKITLHVKKISDEMEKKQQFDGDGNGGQVDAFRHCFWMASLAQKVAWRKACGLGKAHEKGNKKQFNKGNPEDGTLPDKRSIEMDLHNNEVGLTIGRANKNLPATQLQQKVKVALLAGELRIIRKDQQLRSLTCEGTIIPESEWLGKWENERCLVPSGSR